MSASPTKNLLEGMSIGKKILFSLLLFVPIAFVLRASGADQGLIFICAALGIVPLADLIGEATEELAAYTGPKIGGLLNATLGNAAELIITIIALNAGLYELVKASIVGSIIGNLLLVLGLSLLLGGLKNGTQKFDRRTATINSTLLILAIVALTIPSIFGHAMELSNVPNVQQTEIFFSESIAIVMILIYVLSIVYSFTAKDASINRESAEVHPAKWSAKFAIGVLVMATIGVAVMSEVLVSSIEAVTESLGLSEFFIGIIIIPLVGNIAEHLVAVEVAIKNKMELSLAVSLGSSLQIALFVAPLLVFISLLFPEPLLLFFNQFELVVLIASIVIVAFIAQDGESNWLEGAMLLSVYLLIALAFFFLPVLEVAV